jgi:starch phosphorylase
MIPYKTFVVTPVLPQRIASLKELAFNYWWTWQSDAKDLFKQIDKKIWEEVNHNPVALINRLSQKQLIELSERESFVSYLDYVYNRFLSYLNDETWHKHEHIDQNQTIAYFSLEFGINESFPIYSGGLGILAGDHMKSASDLGLPLVGVGLLYQQGYFHQYLTQSGYQKERYSFNDFNTMPLVLMRNAQGTPITISVQLPTGEAFAQIWRAQIGRVPLYLLDTNIEKNLHDTDLRDITDQLYGGDRDRRIQQEIVLGIGGIRALESLGVTPSVVHINEGHAGFAMIERTRHIMARNGITFQEAKELSRAGSIFTTHTPVPAGNEVFTLDIILRYMTTYAEQLGISMYEFLEMGRINPHDEQEKFSMTVLGLKLSAYHNGVSKLHGAVARKMWKDIWTDFPEKEVPIDHITNGIHTKTWISKDFAELYDRYIGTKWRFEADNQQIWDLVDSIPDEDLWRTKQKVRADLVMYSRDHLLKKRGLYLEPEELTRTNEYLDTNTLTIGFARRFATYKRAMLLFSDIERLTKLLTNKEHPIQIVIAGKAHPRDTQGKEVLQEIINKVKTHKLQRYVVFLEDYDMEVSSVMLAGADIWLNTPIRPLEASATSGMKAVLNGTLHMSILDGWWDEAYNGSNGFAIGKGEEYTTETESYEAEAETLYSLLEDFVVPLFYRKEESFYSKKWVQFMKNSIRTNSGVYSTQRMVKEYAEKYYYSAMKNFNSINTTAENIITFRRWKEHIWSNWHNVEVKDLYMDGTKDAYVGKEFEATAVIYLNGLAPTDIKAELYYGSVSAMGKFQNATYTNLQLIESNNETKTHLYKGTAICIDSGMQGCTVRVVPNHQFLSNPAEMYVCSWPNDIKGENELSE